MLFSCSILAHCIILVCAAIKEIVLCQTLLLHRTSFSCEFDGTLMHIVHWKRDQETRQLLV